jgi:hypothetical protein
MNRSQATIYRWAPIIWARTFYRDFRMIVLPTFLAEDEALQWAESLIRDTVEKTPERLRQGPRLAIFQNGVWRVLGITCMVRDLIGREDVMSRDREGRWLHAFLGYAAKREANGLFPAVPTYTSILTMFYGLYPYVRMHWCDTIDLPPDIVEPNFETLDTTLWTHEFPSHIESSSEADEVLNEDPLQVGWWPDSLTMRMNLWRAAIESDKQISLCLGFADYEDAQQSSFLNATIPSSTKGGKRILK